MSASKTDVNPSDFMNARGFSVDHALRKAGLVSMRDRGGESSVKTAALRAFGASQTTISWNGIRLNSDQNGIVDLGLLPSAIVSSATVLRGSQSAAYGSGAMGGVIQLRSDEQTGAPGGLELLGGSFGQRGASIVAGPAELGIPIRMAAGYDAARNDYEYESPFAPGSTLRRVGNDSRRVYGSVVGSWSVNERWKISPSFLVSDAIRRSPGPVSMTRPDDARLTDRLIVAGVRSGWVSSGDATNATLSILDHRQRYVEREPFDTVDQSYTTTSLSILLDRTVAISPSHSMAAFVEMRGSSTAASALRPISDRTSGAIAVSTFHAVLIPGLLLAPSVRADIFSDTKAVASGKFAARYSIVDDDRLVARLGIGTSFRVPTYNEKYWIPGGNEELRPERSLTIEGGCEGAEQFSGLHRWSASLFLSEMTDQIVGWPAVNVSRTRVFGGELNWEWNVIGQANVRAGVAVTRAVSLFPALPDRQLPFIPLLTGVLGFDAVAGVIGVHADLEYASRRFTTTDNIIGLSSEPYVVASVGGTVRPRNMPGGLSGSVRIENIFDRSYEAVKNYPMPRRSIIISLALSLS